MELILTKDVVNVGRKGDVVRVRDGYARNFLLPQNLAISATRSNREFVEDQRRRSAIRKEKEKNAAQQDAKKIAGLKVAIEANAGENGKLFGSVTAEDIAAHVNKQGYSFDKKQILVKDGIRSLGSYQVTIEIYPGVRAAITLDVSQKA